MSLSVNLQNVLKILEISFMSFIKLEYNFNTALICKREEKEDRGRELEEEEEKI